MNNTLLLIAQSWCLKDSKITNTKEILEWIFDRNKNTEVNIKKITLNNCKPWFYDKSEGCIRNENRSFFSIIGCKYGIIEQPIILQREIGYLGIICQEMDGVMHFLMQAKIEPGNINCVQVSPTIQATKSNFTQKHGGNKPPYLNYFINAANYEIVIDQIESEQSSRFYKKRNRNIIIHVQENIELLPNYKWMTLGQIKELMKYDNLVNMDTRTILSCIPFSKLIMNNEEQKKLRKQFNNDKLFNSIFMNNEFVLPSIYQIINNKKMAQDDYPKLIPLDELSYWENNNEELICKIPYPFKIIYCDIAIEGREVKHWTQPLLEANGIATFGLILCEEKDNIKFLVKIKEEIGSYDLLELGPTIQQEAIISKIETDSIINFFWKKVNNKDNIIFDHLLSEEGGRFYHEQNRNILLKVNINELPNIPKDYFLLDYRTLNELVQINNILNIQLRNLLSLLEVGK